MRNVIVLGAARSGTSMLMGTLAKAGYFMGEELKAGYGHANGVFETRNINRINEELLDTVVRRRPTMRLLRRRFIKRLFWHRVGRGQGAFARLPVDTEFPSPPALIERIERLTQREPFCFKDPRLIYTLPVWRPYLRDTVFICMFRNPSHTAESLVEMNWTPEYFALDFEKALDVWRHMYLHVLRKHRREGEWLFVNYDQLLNGQAMDRLEAFTGAPVDRSFPDPSKNHRSSGRVPPAEVQDVYLQLCELAEYEDPAVENRKVTGGLATTVSAN